MLTNDDLVAIKTLFKPLENKVGSLESKISGLDKRIDRFEKKNDKQHNELQAAINRVTDIHDDRIFALEQWEKQVDKKPAFNFAV